MKDFLRMAFILFVVCGLAAGSLAFFNQFTKARIEAQSAEEKAAALRTVFPEATEFRATEPGKRWDALKGSDKAGTVFQVSPMGYSGRIEAVCGLDAAGLITGLRVLSHTETAGLGARITTSAFQDQFKGKTVAQLALKKDAPTGAIDAIAAATISSRAVANAVRAGAAAQGGTK